MKFVSKPLGEAAEVSAGQGSQLKELAKLLSLALVLIITAYLSVGYITETLVSSISIENEKKWLGKLNVYQLDFKQAEPSDKYQRAENILHRLSSNPEVPKLDYKLVILKNKSLNAFAFPGGTIGITSGLFDAITNDTALAFVIGHELGHFKHRHHLKGFSRAITTSIVFSILFGSESDLQLTQQIMLLLDKRHSQKQEIASDKFSATLVFNTLGTTENIMQLFDVLKQSESHKLRIGFLDTHPSSQSRIARLKKLSDQLNLKPSN